jgi:carbon monoxide dehydrogenase subunit G
LAEATYTTTTRVPIGRVWEFVQEMDNWGRFVTGYQKHEKQDDRHSTWTLRGDVGVLSRTLAFRVEITEWSGPERVSFTLTGVNEPMQGAGTFTMKSVSSDGDVANAPPVPIATPAPRGGVFRLLEAFWRWLLGRAGDGTVRDTAATQVGVGSESRTELRFELSLVPGGPMAPMIDAMIRPLMLPAAENLANRILAELEQEAPA